ncbi:winged helix-turn-helix transcriptional regulator [Flavivirga algicola]|uniref:Helix-turn-helix transcriptional regulator n=1 Tax=Flavivirga algicola TaxID=2729136 RepID=A0ABX1RVY2_9FLAO|nr:helix-turn-helix domain-containing protein [Flavivirga algicola]NMH87321.1 helix-turn-helix transcriptional regulator [Flavivirga algicola]
MDCSKENCPMTLAVNMISGKWKLFILYGLRDGEKRYSELRRICEGITEKMLTNQLRELEKDGLIKRKVYPQVPPKVEYSFTEIGERLSFMFDPLYNWGLDYIKEKRPEQYHLVKQYEKTSH